VLHHDRQHPPREHAHHLLAQLPSPEFGDTTTFTFRPDAALQSKSPVVSYSVHTSGGSDGDPEVTVAAGARDTASIDWTPTSDGSNELLVYATTSSGIQLSAHYYYFTVN
jgi:hypothetical protein